MLIVGSLSLSRSSSNQSSRIDNVLDVPILNLSTVLLVSCDLYNQLPKWDTHFDPVFECLTIISLIYCIYFCLLELLAIDCYCRKLSKTRNERGIAVKKRAQVDQNLIHVAVYIELAEKSSLLHDSIDKKDVLSDAAEFVLCQALVVGGSIVE